MGLDFVHSTAPSRVLFGRGAVGANVAAEIARLGATRVMLVTTASHRQTADRMRDHVAITLEWTDVAQHVPAETAASARQAASEAHVDVIVVVGGGSATGLAKAVALTTGIPIIAVPTTYAGSEATDVWGITENGRKQTGSDSRVLPVAIVYDPDLTLSLPQPLSVSSGLNAIAHCVDSLWAPRADPINAALAMEGIRSLTTGLRGITADPLGPDGRERCLLGSYFAATAFASAGSGMHHKICHTLGGTYGLPHAETHAVVLRYVMAFNLATLPAIETRLADAFGARSALAGLDALRHDISAPTALSDLGFTEAHIPEAAQIILPSIPASNPRPVTADDLERLLRAALRGDEPTSL